MRPEKVALVACVLARSKKIHVYHGARPLARLADLPLDHPDVSRLALVGDAVEIADFGARAVHQ